MGCVSECSGHDFELEHDSTLIKKKKKVGNDGQCPSVTHRSNNKESNFSAVGAEA